MNEEAHGNPIEVVKERLLSRLAEIITSSCGSSKRTQFESLIEKVFHSDSVYLKDAYFMDEILAMSRLIIEHQKMPIKPGKNDSDPGRENSFAEVMDGEKQPYVGICLVLVDMETNENRQSIGGGRQRTDCGLLANRGFLTKAGKQWINTCLKDCISGKAIVNTLMRLCHVYFCGKERSLHLEEAMKHSCVYEGQQDRENITTQKTYTLSNTVRSQILHGIPFSDQDHNMQTLPIIDSFSENKSVKSHRTFWRAIEDGCKHDILIFLRASQDVNQPCPETSKGAMIGDTSLIIACTHGHEDIVNILLGVEACVNLQNYQGQTALHLAVCHKHTAIVCSLLLQQRTIIDLLSKDCYGNTSLHEAARCGSFRCVKLIAGHYRALLQKILSGEKIITIDNNALISKTGVRKVYFNIIAELSKSRTKRHFHKDWCWEALKRIMLFVKGREFTLALPSKETYDCVLNQFGPNEDDGIWTKTKGGNAHDIVWVPIVQSPSHLQSILTQLLIYSFVNYVNKLEQTPLHIACNENRGQSHHAVICYLLDNEHCNILAKDKLGRQPRENVSATRVNVVRDKHRDNGEDNIQKNCDDVKEMCRKEILKQEESTQIACDVALDECCALANHGISIWESPGGATESDNLTAREWACMLRPERSTFLANHCGYDIYESRYFCKIFYVDKAIFEEEDAILLIQRNFRQREKIAIPAQWITSAFSYTKPEKIALSEKLTRGWEFLRKRSERGKMYTDWDGQMWTEYIDQVTGFNFFYCSQSNSFQWDPPIIPRYHDLTHPEVKVKPTVHSIVDFPRWNTVVSRLSTANRMPSMTSETSAAR
jgi:ankyrin repeat protein